MSSFPMAMGMSAGVGVCYDGCFCCGAVVIRQMESSSELNGIDFVPPEHRYLQHEPFNSAFFRDHCEEEYQIQRAFRADNFTSLRKKIPNQLHYGAILEQRLQKVQEQTEEEAQSRAQPLSHKEDERRSKIARKKMEQVGQLGYFEVFPYQESLYGVQHDLKLREQETAKRLQQQISPLDFRPAGFDKKLKSEDPFAYIERLQGTAGEKSDYIFPFHLPEDTFDRFHESELRHRIIQEGAKIAGDFTPAGQERSLSKVTKSRAPEIMRELQVFLKKYMPDTGFFIGMSRKDHIDVLFAQNQADNPRLALLMSKLCEHEALCRFLLRRHPGKWGTAGENGYYQFVLLPPWVRDPEEVLKEEK